MRTVAAALLSIFALSARAEGLTIDRIFQNPSLDGPAPREMKITPDGTMVTFLRPRLDDRNRYDLWAFDTDTGEASRIVNADDLADDDAGRSAEAEAMLERKRLVGTQGIVSYDISDDGSRLLVPVDGDAFVYLIDEERLEQVVDTESWETDFQLSPDNRRLAFVRDSNLVFRDLASGDETAVTTDGGGTVSYGMAEFVAQEEMGRYTGYWWSPGGNRIAFTRVEESPVEIARRVEYHAESTEVVEQRYPYAGTDNAVVKLYVHDVASGERRQVQIPDDADEYLFRVDWFPDGGSLAVQHQPRDLRKLDLSRCDAASGKCRRLIREESPVWIERQDNLSFVGDTETFVWSSRRDGYRHLFLYDFSGKLVRRLTAGNWEIAEDDAVAGVDAVRRTVFFTGHSDTPLEKHLYVQSLDTADPSEVDRVTAGAGIHDVTLAENGRVFVDRFESPEQPPQTGLYRVDGELEGWISRNQLGPDHPYGPFLANHVTPEFGTLEARDGQALHYRLFRPAGFEPGRRYPVLVYVYGGPGGQQVSRHWPSPVEHWLQSMAQRGYAVFTLDNRGTGNRGRDFDAPIYRMLGRTEVTDQLTGLLWLKQQAWVDPDRIGVFGWSYGGYMTLMMLAQSHNGFAAGVSGAPVTDWRLYDTYYTERYMDRPQDNGEGYDKGDVLSHAGGLSEPLLVIHGMADDNVLFKHSTRLFKKLQDDGRPFEMMTYPGAKHSLVRVPVTGPHSLGAATRFLDQHLLDE